MQGSRFNILSNDLDVSEIPFFNTVAEGLGKDHKTQSCTNTVFERQAATKGLVNIGTYHGSLPFGTKSTKPSSAMKGLEFSTFDICISFLLLPNGLDQGCKMSGFAYIASPPPPSPPCPPPT